MKKLVVLSALLAVGLCTASGAYAQEKGPRHGKDVKITNIGNGNGNAFVNLQSQAGVGNGAGNTSNSQQSNNNSVSFGIIGCCD